VGADPSGTASAAVSSHEAAGDPHTQYLTPAEGNAAYDAAGTASTAVSNHVGAADPHTQYQKESERAAANGYASLDAGTKVPIAQVPTGTSGTTVAFGNHNHSGVYDPAGTAASGDSAHTSAGDPHPQYLTPAEGNALYAPFGYEVPTSFVGMFPSATPPAGWALCDGTAHGSPALESILAAAGQPNPENTPDLRGMFIKGASAGEGVRSTGGAEAVTLTSAQSGLVGHAHTGSSADASSSHTHSVDPGPTQSGTVSSWHTHTFTSGTVSADHSHSGTTGWMDRNNSHGHTVYEGITTGDSNNWVDSADEDTAGTARTNIVRATDTNHLHGFSTGGISANHTHSGTTANPNNNHSHSVDIAAFTSGGSSSTAHSHGVTVDAVGSSSASQSHENQPPYYVLTYAIKT